MEGKYDVDAELRTNLAAKCPLIYIVSWEEDRVIQHLADISGEFFDRIYTWKVTEGIQLHGLLSLKKFDKKSNGPYGALNFIEESEGKSLFILSDYHTYITDSQVTRKLRDLIHSLQETSSVIVLLSPKLELPMELEKDIAVIDYPLPELDDVYKILNHVEEGLKNNSDLKVNLDSEERETLLQATLGLTENEIKNIFAKALVSDSSLDISDLDIILSEKRQIVRKSGILEYYPAVEDFRDIGGLEGLKIWLSSRKNAFSQEARDFGLPFPKGLLLLGIPGCGKSLSAKAIAHQWGQPLLRLDVGKIFAGLMGSSEENMRRAIKFAEAVAPAVLWIDEIEKGFSGISGAQDSGVSARVFSTFLTWLQEKTSPLFVIATANNIDLLPPEMLRKGRFDEIFFVDLPLPEERKEIFKIHIEKRKRDIDELGLDLDLLTEKSKGFSGAEIEQVIISTLFEAYEKKGDLTTEGILKTLQDTYPLSETMKESIVAMREWSNDRARSASLPSKDQAGKTQEASNPAELDSVAN